ncbi:MAG: hypothetical protein ACK419_00850, partial [Pyrinomonadaceae bacterium]
VYKIHSPHEFFEKYNQTGTICMVMQESIEFEEYYRCYCVGKTHVHIMPYEPRNPHHLRYQASFSPSESLQKTMTQYCIEICEALGYDLNTIEFAVRDGIPYAIDFMNPAPDAELASVGEFNHNWFVNAVAEFVFEKLSGEIKQPEYRWLSLLNGNDSTVQKKKLNAKKEKTKRKETTKKSKTKKKGE